jgi:hypothetical protein
MSRGRYCTEPDPGTTPNHSRGRRLLAAACPHPCQGERAIRGTDAAELRLQRIAISEGGSNRSASHLGVRERKRLQRIQKAAFKDKTAIIERFYGHSGIRGMAGRHASTGSGRAL